MTEKSTIGSDMVYRCEACGSMYFGGFPSQGCLHVINSIGTVCHCQVHTQVLSNPSTPEIEEEKWTPGRKWI